MARALIVGCGCRGRELAERLISRGWQVRGTSRRREGMTEIERAGLEPAQADPDRPATIFDLCEDVAVVVWLLGSATGQSDQLSAIHGARLERLIEKLVESPVRGFAYEAAGSVDGNRLRDGSQVVERAGERWHIPVALLSTARDMPEWSERTAEQVLGLLAR
jgi:nucleoside-diphosphate-sugar epimerase